MQHGVVTSARSVRPVSAAKLCPRLPSGTRLRPLQAAGSGKDENAAGTSSTSSMDEDSASRSQVQRLLDIKREQQRDSTNIIQGAIEEAGLITWPTPKKALLDTVLVLGIVTATGALLFALNVGLTELTEVWYARG